MAIKMLNLAAATALLNFGPAASLVFPPAAGSRKGLSPRLRPRTQLSGVTSGASVGSGAGFPNPDESRVDELLQLVLPRQSASAKTPEQRARIGELLSELETSGAKNAYATDERYVGSGIGGTLLWDAYEVAYFDRAIDGGAKPGERSYSGPFSLRKLIGFMFSLRWSCQHILRRGPIPVVVNDVGFSMCGLPLSIVTKGDVEALPASEVKALCAKTTTPLREDTTIRINFEAPRLRVGPWVFELGGAAQSPPVVLCTTYLDNRVRCALASKGGRLVFTRGGVAEGRKGRYESTLVQRPTDSTKVVLGVLFGLAAVAKLVPVLRTPLKIAAVTVTTLAVAFCTTVVTKKVLFPKAGRGAKGAVAGG